ncbi:hypothetical protein ACEQPO_05035 [Bacillus sp. SL00103]
MEKGGGVWTALYAAGGLELNDAASIVYHLHDSETVNQGWLHCLRGH